MIKTEKVIINYVSGRIHEIISKKIKFISSDTLCHITNYRDKNIIISMCNVESREIEEM